MKDALEAFTEAQDDDISNFFNHPNVSKENKKKVLSTVIKETLVKNFVFVLIDNNRIDLLDETLGEYKKIVDQQNQIMNVVVYSGKLMDISDLNKLKNNLAMKHNRKVLIENIVDVKIVGGLRIEYEGMILDETINNYLTKLKHNLTK